MQQAHPIRRIRCSAHSVPNWRRQTRMLRLNSYIGE